MRIHLSLPDYAILLGYFAFVIAIGAYFRRQVRGSSDFLLSGRSIPAWAAGLAFLSANLGAQEVIGMAASGAKYGLMTSHFYWIGAIPAMVFLGIFMMPFYYGSRARSVPEYLRLRFDEKTRTLNAVSFAVMTIFSSGISMHALASLMKLLLGWDYNLCIALSAGIVLVYILLGGLTSAIYNEVLQFFLIVAGFAPLVIIALHGVGGWQALTRQLDAVATSQGYASGTWTQLWRHLATTDANPMGVEWIGLVMGLGFVLSFGYGCTDFLVVQRALAARSIHAARLTPLIAAIPKMLFPALVILPGMIGIALHLAGSLPLPLARDGTPDYNLTIPTLLARFLPTGLLGIGLTALLASFMSGMAGNVTAFNTVWTWDIYQTHLARNRPDSHYLKVGRLATVFGVGASIAAAYAASRFNNIMDLLQLVFGFVNAPLLATFLLGMFWKRATGHGAFWGLVGGTLGAASFHGLSLPTGAHPGLKGGWLAPQLAFRSEMGQNFYMAIAAFATCSLLTIAISLLTRRTKTDQELAGLVYSLTPRKKEQAGAWYTRPAWVGAIVLAAALALNLLFR
ncbi:MAG TPA: sodium:solute symporter family protein [Steroidobacteraceae bacterium]